ncbi:class I SAM-dependent DNA methyltransferase [Pseudomonadota bacterium]
MNVFASYAAYYDLLYEDKDYDAEAGYIRSLIDHHAPTSASLLDVGCGTGRHAELFARAGLEVFGLDRSGDMIAEANQRNPEIEFSQGDFCSFRFKRSFDVITSLFHVVSYLTEGEQLHAAFDNVHRHLEPGGLFIFDCWHGPAVIHQKPELRIKRLENKTTRVVRIAEPDIREARNRVDVNYQVFVAENGVWDEFKESHAMRYLFRPELEKLLDSHGMRLLHTEEWMNGRNPDETSWSVVYVAGRK